MPLLMAKVFVVLVGLVAVAGIITIIMWLGDKSPHP